MVNPFTHTGHVVRDMFTSTEQCDFFDHTTLKVGAVIITPIVAPIAFISAFFKKS
jgi:hypothetical protein